LTGSDVLADSERQMGRAGKSAVVAGSRDEVARPHAVAATGRVTISTS